MPTRLDVLLHNRKSAAAGALQRHVPTNAATIARPAVMRAEEGGKRRESFTIMQRSYIKSLTISREPAGAVNGRGTAFPRYGKPKRPVRWPILPADMAKSVTIPI